MASITDAREKLIAARVQLQKESPFFSYLVLHLNMTETKDVEVAAVDGKGHLFYNTKFVEKLDIEQCKALLTHEVLHLALEHNTRVGDRDHYIFNVAADLVINTILVNNGFKMVETELKPRRPNENFVELKSISKVIKNLDKKTAEEVYIEIYKKLPKQKDKWLIAEIDFTNDKKEKNGKSGASGKKNGPELPKAFQEGAGAGKDEPKPKDWKKIFTEAAIFAKMRGTLPSGMDRFFEDLYDEKLNWRELLQRYIVSSLPYDYTYSRPSKKSISTGFYMPNIVKENVEVVVAIDMSGSITKEMMQEFLSEVVGILKSYQNVKIRLLTHDTEVHDDYEIESVEELKLKQFHGGGGTDHVTLYKYVREKCNTELLISLTDAYSNFPATEEVRTIFAIPEGYGTNPPYGEIVKLERRDK